MGDPLTLGLVIVAAASVASALLAPKAQLPDTTGPRLGDTGVSSSAYGETIPINFGTVRTGCNVIWATDLVEVKTVTKSEQGKGGSQTTTSTSFEYFLNAQMAIGEGVVARFLRIWADNKLIYDARESSEVFFKYPGSKLRFQAGTEDQLPDPFIEADIGTGDTPANRGIANFVVENMPVADFGNRVPQFTCEATWVTGDAFPSRVLWNNAGSSPGDGDGDIQGVNPGWGTNDDIATKLNEGLFWAAKTSQLAAGTVTWSVVDLFRGRIVSQRFFDGADNPTDDLSDNVTTGIGSPGAVVSEDRLVWTGFPSQSSDNRYWAVDRRSLRVLNKSVDVENGRQWNDAIGYATSAEEGSASEAAILAVTVLQVTGCELVILNNQVSGTGLGGAFIFRPFGEAFDPINPPFPVITNLEGPDFFGNAWGIYAQNAGNPAGTVGILKISLFYTRGDVKGGFNGRGIGLGLKEPFFGEVRDLTVEATGGTTTGGGLASAGIWLDLPANQLILVYVGSQGVDSVIMRYDIVTDTIVDKAKFVDLGLDNGAADTGRSMRAARDQTAVDAVWLSGVGLSGDVAEIKIDDPVNGVTSFGVKTNFSVVVHETGVGGFNLAFGGLAGAIIPNFLDKSAIVRLDNSSPEPVHQIFFDRVGQNLADLADIVTDLSDRVNLDSADLDVSDLVGTTVRGFEIVKRGTARNAIDRLSVAFFFDPVESDNLLKYLTRGKASSETIDFDDLGAALERLPDAPNRVDETDKQEAEIPKQIDVQYIDQERDYQAGDVYAKRIRDPDPTVFGEELQKIELPIVFSADEAEKIADSALAVAWTEAARQKFFLPYRFIGIDPADNVTIVRPDCLDILSRVNEIAFGSGMVSEYDGVEEDLEIYSSLLSQSGGDNFIDQTILFAGDARLFPVDSPLVKDGHSRSQTGTGPYLGTSNESGAFRGTVLHQSIDQLSWQQIDVFDEQVLGGLVIDNAVALSPDVVFQTDTTTEITIVPFDDASAAALVTITDVQLLAENNGAWWGNPIDGYEIVKFRDVTDNGDGTFTLGGAWIRGRRGTNRIAEVGHSTGDDFLLLTPNDSFGMWTRKSYEVTNVGETRFFRATPVGQIFDTVNFKSVVITGTDLKPYEVVHVEDSRPNSPANEDINLLWVRQTRLGGVINWLDGIIEPLLGEEFERYEVVLLVGPTPPAGFSTGDEFQSKLFNDQVDTTGDDFTEAEQAAAGYALSEDVNFTIYQISAVVNRGFPRTHTVPGV